MIEVGWTKSKPKKFDYIHQTISHWEIAHAIVSGGRVVTNEGRGNEPGPNRNSGLIDTKVRIPNVARHFGIATVSLPTMLRALGVNDL